MAQLFSQHPIRSVTKDGFYDFSGQF